MRKGAPYSRIRGRLDDPANGVYDLQFIVAHKPTKGEKKGE